MARDIALLTVQAVKAADGTVVVQLKGEIDISSVQILIDKLSQSRRTGARM